VVIRGVAVVFHQLGGGGVKNHNLASLPPELACAVTSGIIPISVSESSSDETVGGLLEPLYSSSEEGILLLETTTARARTNI